MLTYARIPIAVVTSLLVHVALLIGIMYQVVKVRPLEMHGLMQVTLHPSLNKSSAQPQSQLAETTLSETSKPKFKSKPKLETVEPGSDVPKPTQTIAKNSQISGHFRWRPPSTYNQREVMNAMQLEQIAFQRKAEINAVLQGLSAISSQLGLVITERIDCTQQANDNLDCVPEPGENERSLIVQFFNLAIQAHRLGITENPVRMDFSETSGVSVMLRK
jgi:hypothetical protein